jgi:anti-sigma factor ChrR (cupin superfamily)
LRALCEFPKAVDQVDKARGYGKDGEIPLHEHDGYEHILMLTGSQRDEKGVYEAGTLIINPPGSRHKVTSEDGCIALAIYEKPVRFFAD